LDLFFLSRSQLRYAFLIQPSSLCFLQNSEALTIPHLRGLASTDIGFPTGKYVEAMKRITTISQHCYITPATPIKVENVTVFDSNKQ